MSNNACCVSVSCFYWLFWDLPSLYSRERLTACVDDTLVDHWFASHIGVRCGSVMSWDVGFEAAQRLQADQQLLVPNKYASEIMRVTIVQLPSELN